MEGEYDSVFLIWRKSFSEQKGHKVMDILKVINNNVVSAHDNNNNEIVVMGKGIGFGRKPGDVIEEDKIEKIFSLPKEHTCNFEELVENMPYEHVRIADEAITYASKKLHRELNRNIYITLTDHLNFAIERQKKGITLQNALLWEIKKFYAEEYEIGLGIVEMVRNELYIELPEDEAGFIALHIVNAEMEGSGNLEDAQRIPSIIKDILNIVRYTYQEEIDEGSLSYERFLTHLKFFVQRAMRNEVYDETDMELYEMLQRRYPKAYACAKKIAKYMQDNKGYQVPEAELSYLTAHIARITRK